jgi:hypothetical protein
MTFKKIIAPFMLTILLGGCSSNYHYKNYLGKVEPNKLQAYDLSDNAKNPAIIYFNTITYSAMGIPFHRLLLATHVDGVRLKNAGRFSILDIDGYQALKLVPGNHSIEWCWLSMNALGTGGAQCEFKVENFTFEEGTQYLANWNSRESVIGVSPNYQRTITVIPLLQNYTTEKIVYPEKYAE